MRPVFALRASPRYHGAMANLLDPNLFWRGDAVPVSGRFDDSYYSAENGLSETRHVFLAGNDLPDRWRGRSRFTIGELGFGTGLNFLATWKSWRDSGQTGQLSFVSVEGYPLETDALGRATAAFPEIGELARALIDQLPPRRSGHHLLRLDGGRIELLLVYGEVQSALDETALAADAWYLDGFAPARNPEMWTPGVMSRVVARSRPYATVATFTAAGAVRRDLIDAGFTMEKRRGFGSKRECLAGQLTAQPERGAQEVSQAAGMPQTCVPDGPVAIIGAGIAGMSTARALNDAGAEVTVYDRHSSVGGGASKTPAGLLQPRPLNDGSPLAAFFHAAFEFAARSYDALDQAWSSRGVLVLGRDAEDCTRYQALPGAEAVDAAGCQLVGGVLTDEFGAWFAAGGALDTLKVCAALGDGVRIRFGIGVTHLVPQKDGWRLHLEDSSAHEAAVVILANGIDAMTLSDFPAMALSANRGQISYLAATPVSDRIIAPITFGGYLTPVADGAHVLGSTFDREADWSSGSWSVVRENGHRRNLESIAKRLPILAAALGNVTGGWTGLRATTPDRAPVVGPVPDGAAFASAFSVMQNGGEAGDLICDVNQPGLFVLSGLGSRGFLTAPLAGEILASQILGRPLPVPVGVPPLLQPGRFLARNIKKGRV